MEQLKRAFEQNPIWNDLMELELWDPSIFYSQKTFYLNLHLRLCTGGLNSEI